MSVDDIPIFSTKERNEDTTIRLPHQFAIVEIPIRRPLNSSEKSSDVINHVIGPNPMA